jgi:fatty-acyl-CoA synthase
MQGGAGAVQEERATALYGVPTMFIADLEHLTRGMTGGLRTGIMAGSLAPLRMKRVNTLMHIRWNLLWHDRGQPGSTQTHADAPFDKRVSTVGQVHPHLGSRSSIRTGQVGPIGTPGELCSAVHHAGLLE